MKFTKLDAIACIAHAGLVAIGLGVNAINKKEFEWKNSDGKKETYYGDIVKNNAIAGTCIGSGAAFLVCDVINIVTRK